MNGWRNTLKAWNDEWNGLPMKLLTILLFMASLVLVLVALPYVAPFVLAALFAWMLDPVVRFATKPFGSSKASRGIASAIFVLLLSALLIILLLALTGRILNEIKSLAITLPKWASTASSDVLRWVEGLNFQWAEMDKSLSETLNKALGELTNTLTTLASRLASTVARVAWQTASFLPQGLLFIVLTLMGTFYMSADKERIFGFLRGLLPEKHRKRSTLYRASILKAVLGQVRVAFIMLLVTFTEMVIGFLLMGMDYAVLLALILAALDALPVIGAGLFLVPMCIYGIVVGNATFAIGGGLMYACVIIIRQLVEPRIIGRQLGLYPLATMMAMYAGLKTMGFIGMLLGPVMLLLCKVALTADTENAPAPRRSMAFPFRRKGKKEDAPVQPGEGSGEPKE